MLDVGAGGGRDAAWLDAKGYEVVAVEPSASMRSLAARLHPEMSIQWFDDRLPKLEVVGRSGLTVHVILLSAVWMHIPAHERPRAFRKLIGLLKPGDMLAMTLRHGPADEERDIHPVSLAEIETLARDNGAFVEKHIEATDQLGRADVRWTQLVIRLPDDGTGALPLLRHIILNDNKSSTYKLALLRTLCRVADGSAGLARDHDDEFVALPFGLIALTWIRMFKPLLAAGLPQRPRSVDNKGFGFVRSAHEELDEVSHLDLRVGATFSQQIGWSLHQTLKDAARTIKGMPAKHITYPAGGRIFKFTKGKKSLRPSRLHLNEAYLLSFGEMRVPRHLWTALMRFDVWIAPALIAEWTRLIKDYAVRQERRVDDGTIGRAMTWDDPTRDVSIARDRALALLEDGNLFCVWSGKRLSKRSLDLDHCLPWSAWPCSALWNLMPARRTVNQSQKRDRLPSDHLLRSARDRIIAWWKAAYIDGDPLLAEQFWLEARSSLPTVRSGDNTLDNLFDAVCIRRMRLKHDQQVPEWVGKRME